MPDSRLARARAALGAYTYANPIVTLEFRRVLRGRIAAYFVVFYLVAMGLFSVLSLVDDPTSVLRDLLSIRPGGSANATANTGIMQFSAICVAQFYILVAIMPGLFAGAIPREREHHVFSAIRASLLTPGQLVGGRLFAAGAVALLLLATGTPFLAIGFLTGGISVAMLLAIQAALLVVALFFTAFSLAVGSEFRGSTTALLISYLLCGIFTFPFLMVPGKVMRSILDTDPWSVVGAAALIYLLPAALLIAIARERLAGWHERGSLLRLVLLLAVLFYPAVNYILQTDYFTVPFHPIDLRTSFVISGLMFYSAMTLLCGRAPHPEQVRLPFFTALRQAIGLRALWRENPLGMPAFILLMFLINLAAHAGIALASGPAKLLPAIVFIWSAMFVGMLAWSGFGLFIAFLLRTPRFVSAAVGVNGIVNLSLLFAAIMLHHNKYDSLWFSVVGFFAWYGDDINQNTFFVFKEGLASDFSLIVMLHIVAAYFIWRALYTAWQRQYCAGNYEWRGGSAHD